MVVSKSCWPLRYALTEDRLAPAAVVAAAVGVLLPHGMKLQRTSPPLSAVLLMLLLAAQLDRKSLLEDGVLTLCWGAGQGSSVLDRNAAGAVVAKGPAGTA